MAYELDVAVALASADAGRLDDGLAALTAIIDDQPRTLPGVTAMWASTVRAWLLVRVDAAAPLVEADIALTEAQTVDFPIAVAVGLRTKAFAQLLLGDTVAATTTTEALLDDLLDRGALSNLRLTVDTAASVAYRSGHTDWERLAATARSLPITNSVCSQFEVIVLPKSPLFDRSQRGDQRGASHARRHRRRSSGTPGELTTHRRRRRGQRPACVPTITCARSTSKDAACRCARRRA